MNNKITIVTPTYNRAQNLIGCFISLLSQTIFNFSWLIIDDGSSDDTQSIINKFSTNLFDIDYYYKENGGKHTAINYSLNYVHTPLFVVLDSDDLLAKNTIEIILEEYSKIMIDNIAVLTFMKADQNGLLMGKPFEKEGVYDYFTTRFNSDKKDEKLDVFNTEIFKKNMFSEYLGEKYIGESTVLVKLAENHKMIGFNSILYYAQYLENGLTKSGRKLRVNNPIGGLEYTYYAILYKKGIINKVKYIILCNTYKVIAGKKRANFISVKKINMTIRLLEIIFMPFGIALAFFWMHYKHNK
jgi:glycosyltransferase involved in cell wall biosynthesis